MILTVTINPLLEKRLIFKNISLGKNNRSENEFYAAGGKGINVSRQLNLFDIKNSSLTFLGGNNGKILKNLLFEEKINFTSVSTKSETRSASVIVEEENKRATTFFGVNLEITENELNEFKIKLEKMIELCEIVIFSGSSPNKIADEIFPFGIELANKYDKISICDTYGNHLKNCIEKSPTIIHNNFEETEKSLNISLKNENEILDYLKFLYEKGIKQSYLTDGSNPVYASNFDFVYKAENPKINEIDSTGSGDAFTAGIAYYLHNSLTFEDGLKFAISLGALNAQSFDVCRVKKSDAQNLKDEIQISPIGKKIVTLVKENKDL